MIPFLVAGDEPGSLLIATLEGDVDIESVTPLGRSFLGRMKRKAGNVAVAPVRAVAHGTANIGRATGRVGMQLSRGNIKGALVDLGRAATTTLTTPVTMAVSAVAPSAGRKLEGIIKRNDPMALINRKIFEGVKAAVRPIVRKFSGDGDLYLGEDAPPAAAQAAAEAANMVAAGASKKSVLRAARGKIIAASTAAGTAAGTAVAGPYGAPIGASLVPSAVDAVIEELTSGKTSASGRQVGVKNEPVESSDLPASSGPNLKTVAMIAGAGVLAVVLLKKRGR